ncbi:FAD dependent oxidoreductase domain-containing protein [Sarocladium implicatum]|nr:FAD dependent oxidoreductase domain-containing protein [Sarocladium implicatum]
MAHAISNKQAELPTEQSTASFWHRDPSEALVGHRTTHDLPTEADVVVIGSGITGAFAARTLRHSGWNQRVVMLEAREACWGATGRNGGHCQPLVYLQPAAVAAFELDTYAYLDKLITQNDIACDWKTVGGVHPIKSPKLLATIKKRMEEIAKHSPALASKVEIVEDPRELRTLRVEGAIGAVYQHCAAKCWPYKLVAWILEGLTTEESAREADDEQTLFNLQTNTPATSLLRLADGAWAVQTPRGQVKAKNVLLATNAYTSHLLPRMTDLIVPVRGQVSALARPSGSVQLRHSYAWIDHGGGDNYLIHRDDDGDGGPLIFGGERLVAEGHEVGVSRDDVVNKDVARALRRTLHGALRLKKNDKSEEEEEEEEEEELEAEFEWTGIMGYTPDEQPWVGAVPESLGGGEGLWISAGYTGHGMPVAARTGIAVAEMILGIGDHEGAVRLPEEYAVSEQRIKGKGLEELDTLVPVSMRGLES